MVIQNLAADLKTRLCFFTPSIQIKANLVMDLIEGTRKATLVVMARTSYRGQPITMGIFTRLFFKMRTFLEASI